MLDLTAKGPDRGESWLKYPVRSTAGVRLQFLESFFLSGHRIPPSFQLGLERHVDMPRRSI